MLGLLGYLAHRLGAPPLVGYLVAGILVGPATPGYVADMELTIELAEIGVMLMMFGVGLHFSIRDLLAVQRIAVPGAIVQIAAATGLATLTALSWGWDLGASLVFGTALSVASVVLVSALVMAMQLGPRDFQDGTFVFVLGALFATANLVWAFAGIARMQRLMRRYEERAGRAFDGLPVVFLFTAIALAIAATLKAITL